MISEVNHKIVLIIGCVALLSVLGVGLFVTGFTDYLGNDPSTCNNCHVMDAVFEGWYHAGHQEWAVCGDCHTPHSLIPKYYIKALSGYHHVTAFISGNIPIAIRAKPESEKIIQKNCIRCHARTIEDIMIGIQPFERKCWDCHRVVSHGERGLSLYPYQYMESVK